MTEEYLTSSQLQKMLNVSKKFIDKYVPQRRLPGMVRVGGLWRFKRSAVERQLATGELLLPEKRRRNVRPLRLQQSKKGVR